MSVLQIDESEYGRILKTLIFDRSGLDLISRSVFTYNDENHIMRLNGWNSDIDEVSETHIGEWVERLYIANQLAFITQYRERTQIDFLPDEISTGKMPMSMRELYKSLSSIQYNLFNNAGRCFLSGDDMERLTNLIAATARRIIET